MRRSSTRGWVAKAYPEQQSSSSQPNLDLEHFTSSQLESESLDSFFDDEYEEQDQDEKLGLLLSCNTLGVESKVSLDFNIFMLQGLLIVTGWEARLDFRRS